MSHQILKGILIFSAFLVWLPACGYKEGVLVKEPVSYLWFTGNVQQSMVKVDEREPFDLSKAVAAQEGRDGKVYYQIPPGKHRVIVEKSGQRVVDKIFYIGDGNIQEVAIP
jgi:hypothetical protein